MPMAYENEFPANWDKMSESERTVWLANWMGRNVREHKRIANLNRDRALQDRLVQARIQVTGSHKKK